MGMLQKIFQRGAIIPNDALLDLGGGDCITEGQAKEGIFVSGATGSGKTTGPFRHLRRSALRRRSGIVALCVKPGDARDWIADATLEGRADDIILIDRSLRHRINPFAYYAAQPSGIGRDPHNLSTFVNRIWEFGDRATEEVSMGENAYFSRTKREDTTYLTVPLFAAYGNIAVDDTLAFVASAPTSTAQVADEHWRANSFCYKTLVKAAQDPAMPGIAAHDVRNYATHWLKLRAQLDPKTRSNITSTLTSALLPFAGGILRELFCTHTTWVPEMLREGAIVIVDLPIKSFGEAGVIGNLVIKFLCQIAMEATLADPSAPPVMFAMDEYQLLWDKYDKEFFSTARSANIINVCATQNISGLQAAARGRDSQAVTDAMLGNFQTKIFLQNTDPVTNRYASDLIGKTLQRRYSGNWSENHGTSESQSWSYNSSTQIGESEGRSWGGQSSYGSSYGNNGSSSSYSGGSNWGRNEGWSGSRSAGDGYSHTTGTNAGGSNGGGWTEVVDDLIQPREFAVNLRKGGAASAGLVDAIVVQGGRRFNRTGAHWLPCTFQQ